MKGGKRKRTSLSLSLSLFASFGDKRRLFLRFYLPSFFSLFRDKERRLLYCLIVA